jgi:hypothetical protein
MALDSDTQPDIGTYAVGRSLWYNNGVERGHERPSQTGGREFHEQRECSCDALPHQRGGLAELLPLRTCHDDQQYRSTP